MYLSDEGPTLEKLAFAFYIGSTPTFLYFDLYLNVYSYRGPWFNVVHTALHF